MTNAMKTASHRMSQSDPRRPTVSLVIPTLNEEKNVGWVLERLPSDVDEVIVVDGRSTDGTIAAALRARPDAVIVEEPLPGKGAALRAGFARATGDLIVMIDAGCMLPSASIITTKSPVARA